METFNKFNFPFKSILIVCSVNVARSRIVEGYLDDFFKRQGLTVKLDTGGIAPHARDGMLISQDAKIVMAEEGIALSTSVVSKDLKKYPEVIDAADLIITLTEQHKNDILKHCSSNSKTVLTLKEFAGEFGDIEDPSMKDTEGFRRAREEIKYYLNKGLRQFSE